MEQSQEDTSCPVSKEIRELKSDTAGIKMELREVRTTLQVMEEMMIKLPRRLGLNAEIIVAGGHDLRSAEIFNMTTRTWRPLPEMTEYRDEASSVLYEGRVIVTGGIDNNFGTHSSAEELNFAQQCRWVRSQFQLPQPFGSHACVVYQNCLLVIGGYDIDNVYDRILAIQMTNPYDTRVLATLPRPLCYHGAQIVNDKVYIVGGSDTIHCADSVDTIFMFDPQTNECRQVGQLPYHVSSMATTTWQDNVVVLGGVDRDHNELNSVVMYNVTNGNHQMLPEMRNKRYGCTAVTIGDNILVIGGRGAIAQPLDSVECFNFGTYAWTDFPAMIEARPYPTAVARF